jgi:hypothetical protein
MVGEAVDKGKRVEAVGYIRTSSAANVGDGKDSEVRQRKAIEGYAKATGISCAILEIFRIEITNCRIRYLVMVFRIFDQKALVVRVAVNSGQKFRRSKPLLPIEPPFSDSALQIWGVGDSDGEQDQTRGDVMHM